MSRDIDLSKSLTDEEKQYLVDRERWNDLERNAEATGDDMPSRDGGPVSPQASSARVADQTVVQVPDGSNPAPASLGARQRGAGNTEATRETEDRPYEDWDKDDLKEEAGKRGLKKGGNKQELADRLRAHDAEGESGEVEESEDEDTEDDEPDE